MSCGFSFGVVFFLFLSKQVLLCFGGGQWRISRQFGPWISRNLTITQDPHIWGRTNFGPAQTTELPGHKPLVFNVVVVGPFEEEETGIGIVMHELRGQVRERPIDKLDEACTNADVKWCLCDTAAATASWDSVDLDGFLEQTASGLVLGRDSRRGCKSGRPTTACTMLAQERSFCTVACARMYECICIFAKSVVCISTGVVSTIHVQVCTLNRCCEHQRTHLRTHSLQDVHMRSCMCSLFIQHWGTSMGGFS